MDGFDLVLEDGHELCKVLDALVVEIVRAVSDVDVQASASIDLDVEFYLDERNDLVDLLEAHGVDWKNGRDQLYTCVGEAALDIVAVVVRQDAYIACDCPGGITMRAVNIVHFNVLVTQVLSKLLVDMWLV